MQKLTTAVQTLFEGGEQDCGGWVFGYGETCVSVKMCVCVCDGVDDSCEITITYDTQDEDGNWDLLVNGESTDVY